MKTPAKQLDAEIAEALTTPTPGTARPRLKLKRVRPGYYTGRSTTRISDRQAAVVEVEVIQRGAGSDHRWYTTVEALHDQGSSRILAGEDTYATKHDAVVDLERMLAIGFRHMNWGGYAVSP
jgi:hypothetical protein